MLPDVRFARKRPQNCHTKNFKELKETAIKEVKEVTELKILHEIENDNKEVETIQKNRMEILELKSTIVEVKNSLRRAQRR